MRNKVLRDKSIFYTLIVLFLCIVDQRRGSASGQAQFIFVNLAGVAVCLLMFSTYRLKEFCKFPYWVWTIAYGIGAVAVTCLRGEVIRYQGQWYTALLNVWLLGLLLIRMTIRYVFEKWRPNFSIKALVLFLGFIVLACLSKNDSLWTWWYLFLFAMLYLTDFSPEDRKCLLNALPNGIILGFFVIQGMAFVFRPYDVLRYMGMFGNPNINALFYSLVYCAFLGKYCKYFGCEKDIKGCRFLKYIVLLFCGALWSLACFTMCRSAMLSMLLATVCAGVYCLNKTRNNVVRNAVGMACGLVISIVLCAPITYCAVRYLPPLFHHPIWFGGEYSEDKVHSWDPIDSPKYVNWEQILEGLLGRWGAKTEEEPAAYIASIDADRLVAKLVASRTPVMEYESESSVEIRNVIYHYYLRHLNLCGHANAEVGLQVSEGYWAPHAHNLFLQMAFCFGIPAGIFFVIWLGYSIAIAGKKAFGKGKDSGMITLLLFYINIVAFGMLEIVWLTGQLSFALLFIMPLLIFGKDSNQLVDVKKEQPSCN